MLYHPNMLYAYTFACLATNSKSAYVHAGMDIFLQAFITMCMHAKGQMLLVCMTSWEGGINSLESRPGGWGGGGYIVGLKLPWRHHAKVRSLEWTGGNTNERTLKLNISANLKPY
jgi:hypothetical protein